MKKRKVLKILVFIMLSILLVATGFLAYNYLTVFELNKYIDVSGVKFLMSQRQVEDKLGFKGEPTMGFGFSGFVFSKENIQINFIYDGLFAGKVTGITTSNPIHSIFGIHVGDSYDEAVIKAKGNGFLEDSKVSGRLRKGIIHIVIQKESLDSPTIKGLTIGIDSWSPIPKTY